MASPDDPCGSGNFIVAVLFAAQLNYFTINTKERLAVKHVHLAKNLENKNLVNCDRIVINSPNLQSLTLPLYST